MSDIFDTVIDQNDEIPTEAKLEDLVGEDKRYKTPEDAARAILEKDAFIERLKAENAEMREATTRSATLDEILTQIRQANPNPPEQVQPPQAPEVPVQDQNIEELVSSLLQKKEAETRVKSNQQVVEDTLKDRFGADAALHLNKRAKELGVDLAYLKRIASESPKAFFELVGINRAQVPPSPAAPRTGRTTPEVNPGTRNKAYYDRLKAQSPTEYFSPKVQNQLYKDAMSMKEAFYS